MGFSSTEICNMALAHLGQSKAIADMTTEQSKEAVVCRRFYTISLNTVLGDFAWPFATRFADLALVEEEPTEEWAYSYRLPSDCLTVRRVRSGARQDSAGSRIAFRIVSDTTGALLFTDMDEASIEYTVMPADTSTFSAAFVEALALRLAALMAPAITAGDPFKLGDRAQRAYMSAVVNAQVRSAGQEQLDPQLDSEFILGRE